MATLRAVVLLAGFLALTLVLMPVQLLFKCTSLRLGRWLPQVYHRVLARMLGFHVKVAGPVPEKGPVLLVANHVSWIDIVAMSTAMPLSFIAKKEVAGWPLFGQMAKLQRSVFVDRERRHDTSMSRDVIAARLAVGDTLVLFPEGTSHDGINMLPFKSSLFGIVASGSVQVVPVTVAYRSARGLPMTHRQRPSYAWYGDMELPKHLWQALRSGPIGIELTFHAPLTAKSRKDQAKAAESLIRAHLARRLHGRG
jgi:lyso-ornithine lipid O-acyltransferase